MQGIIITTDNKLIIRDFPPPLHRSVHDYFDWMFEAVRPVGLKAPYLMLVHESGLLIPLPENEIASALYDTPTHGYPIAGDAIIMKIKREDIVGLSEKEVKGLTTELGDLFNAEVINEI